MSRSRKIVRTKRIYRKKSSHKKLINTIIFILLIIVLVAFGYIVSREWAKRFGPNAPQSSLPVSSTGSVSNNSPSSEAEDLPVSSDIAIDTALSDVKAAYVSSETLLAQKWDNYQSYFASLKTQGYTAVYIELKPENGIIQYNTQNEMAKKYQAVSENAIDLTQLISAVKQAELVPIARISALKDYRAPHVENENSFAYSNQLETNWLDDSMVRGGKPWLNPYMDNARQYVVDISKEIVDAGFEALVLENVNFPDKNTAKMNVVNQTKSYAEILRQLLDEVQTAVGDTPVYVGYHNESFVKTKENPYYVSAQELGWENVVIIIEYDDLNRVMLNVYSEDALTNEQMQEGTQKLLDAVKTQYSDNNAVITFVPNSNIAQMIASVIESNGFVNTIR